MRDMCVCVCVYVKQNMLRQHIGTIPVVDSVRTAGAGDATVSVQSPSREQGDDNDVDDGGEKGGERQWFTISAVRPMWCCKGIRLGQRYVCSCKYIWYVCVGF